MTYGFDMSMSDPDRPMITELKRKNAELEAERKELREELQEVHDELQKLKKVFGTNPCSKIVLRPDGFFNRTQEDTEQND